MRKFTLNRRPWLNARVCSLLALALLGATSQYLAHFHVPRANTSHAAQLDVSADHTGVGHCSLCVQFERLPAPPVPANEPVALFFAVAAIAAAAPQALAAEAPHLWPPARAPPFLTC